MKSEKVMPVKITALEVENVKRVQAVTLDCSGESLTVLGGRNGQGKTSVLDAIVWTLGGDRFRPSNPVREGAEEARIKVTLDNGITVERKGANGALKVTSADGKGGQTLLNEFVNLFSLNLPKFMNGTGKEKAKILLDAFPGLGAKLQRLNEQVAAFYEERHGVGVSADRKEKYAAELPYDEAVPDAPLSGNEMAARLRDALAVNARNDNLRRNVKQVELDMCGHQNRVQQARARVQEWQKALDEAQAELKAREHQLAEAVAHLDAAKGNTADLKDQDTTAIEREMEQIDALNARVRANESKRHAETEAVELREQYNDLTGKIESARAERLKLLASVELPLTALSIDEQGELIYRGQQWDCMSGAEQLKVAAAICAAMKPECGFVLLDKLECMDTRTLREFGEWLQERNLQAIGTRVSTGEECSIVIEDGLAVDADPAPVKRALKF